MPKKLTKEEAEEEKRRRIAERGTRGFKVPRDPSNRIGYSQIGDKFFNPTTGEERTIEQHRNMKPRFDIGGVQLTSEEFERAKKFSSGSVANIELGRESGILSDKEVEALMAQRGIIAEQDPLRQREEALGEAGATELRERLETGISDPLELEPTEGKPEVLLERAAELGFKATGVEKVVNLLRSAGGLEPFTAEEMAETKTGKALGTTLSVVGGSAIVMSAMGLLSLTARTTIGSSISGKITGNKLAQGVILGSLLDDTGSMTGVITDKDRGDIDTYIGKLTALEGTLSSLQSAISGGAYNDNPLEAIDLIHDIVNDIDEAEGFLKKLGNDNLKYQNDKEWVENMEIIRKTRTNALERLNVVETIFTTGRPTPEPDKLVQSVESLTR